MPPRGRNRGGRGHFSRPPETGSGSRASGSQQGGFNAASGPNPLEGENWGAALGAAPPPPASSSGGRGGRGGRGRGHYGHHHPPVPQQGHAAQQGPMPQPGFMPQQGFAPQQTLGSQPASVPRQGFTPFPASGPPSHDRGSGHGSSSQGYSGQDQDAGTSTFSEIKQVAAKIQVGDDPNKLAVTMFNTARGGGPQTEFVTAPQPAQGQAKGWEPQEERQQPLSQSRRMALARKLLPKVDGKASRYEGLDDEVI